jgi:DNA-binding transcriptional MocR family regulator
MLDHHWIRTESYLDLSGLAVKALTLFMDRFNGGNNGEIAYSVRDLAKDLGCTKDTANTRITELINHGFLRCRQPSSFEYKLRLAAQYELTMFPYRDEKATKDFMTWSKKQNTVPKNRTDSPKKQDREKPSGNNITANGPKKLDCEVPSVHPHGHNNLDTYNIPQGVGSERTATPSSIPDLPPFLDRRAAP